MLSNARNKTANSNPFTSGSLVQNCVLTAPMILVADCMKEDTIDIVKELLETARTLLLAQARATQRNEAKQAWHEENEALGGGVFLYCIEFTEEWE